MVFSIFVAGLSSDINVIEPKKHIVLLAGDEEYRSEEMLPQLAKILETRHGFKCTVVFSRNEQGEIDPNAQNSQPGIEALASADLCVMMLRFRGWNDREMKYFVDFYQSGKPIIALRTSTHAFDYPADSTSIYKRFAWRNSEWPGGFGKQVLGETWVSHWGNHGSQGTRGVAERADHPILKGVADVFVTTDVYEALPPPDATIIMRGQVVSGMNQSDPPAQGEKTTAQGVKQPLNDPMMPVLWTREHLNETGKTNRIVTCTMGASEDFLNPGFRRLVVNSVFWGLGLDVPDKASVEFVGEYKPSPFGFRP